MDGLRLLNAGPMGLAFGGARVEVLHWAYEAELEDNLWHRHTHYEACLVGRWGAGRFGTDGATYALEPGTLMLARPGLRHRIENTGERPMELFWCSFGLRAAPEPTAESERRWSRFAASPALVALDRGGRLRGLWEALHALAASPYPGTREQARLLASALLLEYAGAILEEGPEERPAPSRVPVRMAIRFLEDNLSRPVSLAELSHHAGLSERHLLRLFRQKTGTTPAQYALALRLDRANGLLRRSEWSVGEVARRCGFGDAPWFARAYRRRFGHSPSQARPLGGIGQPLGGDYVP